MRSLVLENLSESLVSESFFGTWVRGEGAKVGFGRLGILPDHWLVTDGQDVHPTGKLD